jgi:AraC-like DNA-binding protein
MMEYQQSENTSSDFRRDIASIKAGAQHLSLLIGDVLDLTKSHAGELRLTYEPVNLQKIVNEVCLLAEPLAREKGLSWEIEIPGQLPVVLGDRVRLSQVLLNLVSNAIKFTDQGSVNLKVQPGSEIISILVCDTGLGIPEVEQAKIFDEFWQSERTIQFGWGGMGLGLAISKKLVELHGGTIGVRSSGIHGTGSTFFFTLPIMKEMISPLPEENERSKIVLLLTENPDRVELVSEFLLGRGFEVDVLTVHNEIDWITGVINSPPGAIVLDFEPAFDRGWDLMRILKENRHTQNIPVVFFSLLEKKSGGAILEFDYLTKPIGSAELARAIKRHGISSKSRQDTLILVVEDDPPLLDLHVRVIQSHFPDCQLLKARNGREALDVMQINPPDLVILDLMMPEIDGFGVIENMRNHEHTRNIPIIVITAQILTCQEMDRLQHGVAAVLGKGVFSVDEVLSQIETALCKNKQLGCQAQQVVRQAMAFIHEHYSEQITRDDLAKYVAVSPRYLTRCFREETGLTPITYLNRYRMNRAKYLLEKGDKTITEVAIAVGFSNSNYFGRVFHRDVGVSPSEYHLGRRPD